MTKTRARLAGCLLVVVAGLLSWMPDSFAQGRFDHCEAILRQDLVNRITFSTTSNTSAHYILNSEVFQFTADQSWQTYEREVDSRKKQGQKGSAGIPIKGIPIELTGDVNYERALSEREYKERFNSLKQQFTARHGQQSSSTSSLASAFASEIRDANSIEAWKKCVTAIDVPNIYAYASRDESGEPFLNVIWSPANLAGLFPSIKIEFVLPAGATISNPSTHVAMGSGRTFRLLSAAPH
jgi:hypothetical protein